MQKLLFFILLLFLCVKCLFSQDYCNELPICSGNNSINILFVYTAAAIDELNMGDADCIGDGNPATTIECLINEINNTININSGILTNYEIVHIMEIDFEESPDNIEGDHEKLYFPSDGNIDDVHLLRDYYNADMVCLLSDGDYENSVRGIANYQTIKFIQNGVVKEVKVVNEERAFSIVEAEHAFSNYTLPHELGHILGAIHAIENLDPNEDPNLALLCPSSLGYINLTQGWCTIMGKCDNTLIGRIPYFSNPNNTFQDVETGTADAYAVLGMNNIACEVITFRQSQVEEEQELVGFYNSTNGGGWSNSWDISGSMIDWYGINTVELALDNNPTTYRTSELNLSGNNLSGTLPNLKLPLLKTLDLSNNTISTISDFRYLWNIKTIDLQNNILNHELPPFTNCTELTFLLLQNNQFSGSLHDFLMPDLLSLDISNNLLSGVIPNFSYLPSLEVLALENNDLSGSIPQFTVLENLTNLFVANNNLKGQIPDFSSKQYLGYVDLRNNQFTFEDILPSLTQNEMAINVFQYAPQQEVGEELFVEVAINGDYTLCVDIDHDIATSIYKWYKGAILIATTDVNEYTLENLGYSGEGVYHCEVTNPNAPSLVLISKDVTINIIEEVAPDIIWSKEYGGVGREYAYDICYSNDNNFYLICGYCPINGEQNLCVKKITQSGNIVWERDYGGSENDAGHSIIQANNGQGYIIAGSSRSSDGDVNGNNGSVDTWIVAIDENGVLLWSENYGGWNGDIPERIISTNDNDGYIVLSRTGSDDGDINGYHGDLDYWVFKIDNSGVLEWSKAFGGTDADHPKDITPTIDGDGYIVIGSTVSEDGDVSQNIGIEDTWYFNLSEEGAILWSKSYNVFFLAGVRGKAITFNNTSDGYVIGAIGDSFLDGPGGIYPATYCAFEIDTSGNARWFKHSPIFEGVDIGRICRSNEHDGYITAGIDYPNGKIVKIDNYGNLLWQKSSGDNCYSIIPSIDTSGYVSVGYNLIVNEENYNWWAFQLDGSIPLPVELENFIGHEIDDKNRLEWRTQSEENVIQFTIERSIDGVEWKEIGIVNAKGNSMNSVEYQFDDNFPLEKAYYRLKIINYDDQQEFSPVIYIERNIDVMFSINHLFPNPTNGDLIVELSSTKQIVLQYYITDISGVTILSGNTELTRSKQNLNLSLVSIPPGVYLLTCNTGREMAQMRFVKY